MMPGILALFSIAVLVTTKTGYVEKYSSLLSYGSGSV
jgi:hypothetical protein